ncbi:MAG: hypothetical protein ACP5JT_05720 [Thermoplasmata archaeon]|jgi:RPA family protein
MPREPAWRVFSFEFNDSIILEKKGEEKEAQYILTKLGAKINRVFMVGILEDKRSVANDSMIIIDFNDRFGNVKLMVDKNYTPGKVFKFFSTHEPPELISFVGKVRIWGENNNVELRVESVSGSNEFIYRYWKLKSLESLIYRIKLMELSIQRNEKESLLKEGYPKNLVDNIFLSIEKFGNIDLNGYKNQVYEILGIKKEEGMDKEKIILEIIERLDTSGKGAKYDDVVKEAEKYGISAQEVDRILNDLLERGILYEPNINYIKIL